MITDTQGLILLMGSVFFLIPLAWFLVSREMKKKEKEEAERQRVRAREGIIEKEEPEEEKKQRKPEKRMPKGIRFVKSIAWIMFIISCFKILGDISSRFGDISIANVLLWFVSIIVLFLIYIFFEKHKNK